MISWFALQRLLPLGLKVSEVGLTVTSWLFETISTVTGAVGCDESLNVMVSLLPSATSGHARWNVRPRVSSSMIVRVAVFRALFSV